MPAEPLREKKRQQIIAVMKDLNIKEDDLIEKFIFGSGKGGQKINKTASCVYIKHKPSGIEVKCQKSRSRANNRMLARRILCEQLQQRIEGKQTERQKKIYKIKRQKKRRSRKQKEKILKNKHHQSYKKQLRKNINDYENE
jgi:peptide chain release factor